MEVVDDGLTPSGLTHVARYHIAQPDSPRKSGTYGMQLVVGSPVGLVGVGMYGVLTVIVSRPVVPEADTAVVEAAHIVGTQVQYIGAPVVCLWLGIERLFGAAAGRLLLPHGNGSDQIVCVRIQSRKNEPPVVGHIGTAVDSDNQREIGRRIMHHGTGGTDAVERNPSDCLGTRTGAGRHRRQGITWTPS